MPWMASPCTGRTASGARIRAWSRSSPRRKTLLTCRLVLRSAVYPEAQGPLVLINCGHFFLDSAHAIASLVPRLQRRLYPAWLALAAFGQAAAAFSPWQRLLRAGLYALAATPGRGFRPVAVRCPGPWRHGPWRPLPRLEPQRRTGPGGLCRGTQGLCRGAGVCLGPQLRRGADQPDAGPATAAV